MQFVRPAACALSALLLLSPSVSQAARTERFDFVEEMGKCPNLSPAIADTSTQLSAYNCIGAVVTKGETRLDKTGSTRAKYVRGSTIAASTGLLGLVFGAADVGGTTLKVWAAAAVVPGMWNDLASPKNSRMFMLSGAHALGQLRERYKALWLSSEDFRVSMQPAYIRDASATLATCETLRGMIPVATSLPDGTDKKVVQNGLKGLQETCDGLHQSRLALALFEARKAERIRFFTSAYADDAVAIWRLVGQLIEGNWPEPADASGIIARGAFDGLVSGNGSYSSRPMALRSNQVLVPLKRFAVAGPSGTTPSGPIAFGGDAAESLAGLAKSGDDKVSVPAGRIKTTLAAVLLEMNADARAIATAQAAADGYAGTEKEAFIIMTFEAPRGGALLASQPPAAQAAPTPRPSETAKAGT